MTCERLAQTDFAAYLAEPRDPAWQAFRAHYPGCRECCAELRRWSALEEALRDVTHSHPSDERLLAFRRSPASLAAAEREALAAHLAGCAPCRDALAAATSLDLGSILARAKPAAEATRAPAPRRVLRGLFARPALAALAAAALVALVVIPFVLGGESDRRPEAVPPVAQAPAPPPPPLAPARSSTPGVIPVRG